MNQNRVSDVSQLAFALKTNSSLKVLYLHFNKIVDVTSFGIGLKTNTNLSRLSLSHNPILAPRILWQDLDQRIQRDLDLLGTVGDLRCRRRDYHAFAIATATPSTAKIEQNGLFSLDGLVRGIIQDMLWHSSEQFKAFLDLKGTEGL
jgi:hypothetical protein